MDNTMSLPDLYLCRLADHDRFSDEWYDILTEVAWDKDISADQFRLIFVTAAYYM